MILSIIKGKWGKKCSLSIALIMWPKCELSVNACWMLTWCLSPLQLGRNAQTETVWWQVAHFNCPLVFFLNLSHFTGQTPKEAMREKDEGEAKKESYRPCFHGGSAHWCCRGLKIALDLYAFDPAPWDAAGSSSTTWQRPKHQTAADRRVRNIPEKCTHSSAELFIIHPDLAVTDKLLPPSHQKVKVTIRACCTGQEGIHCFQNTCIFGILLAFLWTSYHTVTSIKPVTFQYCPVNWCLRECGMFFVWTQSTG